MLPRDKRYHFVQSYGWAKRPGEPLPSVSALTVCGKDSAVQIANERVTFFAEATDCPHCQRKLKKGA